MSYTKRMRRLFAVTVLAALALTVGARAEATRERTLFLVGLPAIGNVYWRCNGHWNQFGLTFRAFRTSATDRVALRVHSRMIRVAVVQPGRTLRLPYVRSRVQQLRFVQGTETGVLRAWLTVDFIRGRTYSYCWPYVPPKLTLRVFPR